MTPESRAVVAALAACGIPQKIIAQYMNCAWGTLDKHYREELTDGLHYANARVVANLYRMAIGEGREALTAAIFWAKTKVGMKETSAVEVSGRDGKPIEAEVTTRVAPYVEAVRGLGGLDAVDDPG